MGVDAADYDQDGWIDLFVANVDHEAYSLYHNDKDDTFDDVDEPYNHPLSPTDGYSAKVKVLHQFIIDGLSAQLVY